MRLAVEEKSYCFARILGTFWHITDEHIVGENQIRFEIYTDIEIIYVSLTNTGSAGYVILNANL